MSSMFPIFVDVDGFTSVTMYENGTARMDTCSWVKKSSSVQYLTWKWMPVMKDIFVTGNLRYGLETLVPKRMREAYINATHVSVANILEEE